MLRRARRPLLRWSVSSPLPIDAWQLEVAEGEMPNIVSQDYRDAMATLGAAVSIVTTDGKAGRAGFTASAV
ncbi:hypothetical protein ACVIIV_003521 [Bradyrhizobium sp. USDA 4354]